MRIVRRLTHVLVLVLTLVVGAAAAAIIVSQTAWFKNWLRGYIVAQANQYLNGTLSIERLGGNLFFGIEMENIGVSMDGTQVVAVKDLGLDYNIFQLITRGLSVDSIRLNKPVIYLRREGDTWSLSRLVKKQEQEADREGPARPIAIDAIELTDGAVVIDQPVGTSGVDVPKRFEHLDAKLSFNYEPVRYSIEITQLSFRGRSRRWRSTRCRAASPSRTTRSSSRSWRCGRRSRRCRSTAPCSTISRSRSSTCRSARTSCRCRRFARIVPALAGVQAAAGVRA